MAAAFDLDDKIDDYPVIADVKDFDRTSGVLAERIIFNYRWAILIGCILLTVLLGYKATSLKLNANFEKMMPHGHPYIKNYLENKDQLRGLGNSVYITVENTQGDIFDAGYLKFLMEINDEVFLVPGVERPWMKSLWAPVVRWVEVNEEGFAGGPIIPSTYDGSKDSVDLVRQNIAKAGIVGKLVAEDFKSTMIQVPLLDFDPTTGKALVYAEFSRNLEEIRNKYEAQSGGKIKIHITGFAEIVGNLIAGVKQMLIFFAFAAVICAVVVYLYTRCIRSTIVLSLCALLAVFWQLGIVAWLGYELDPYQILVPFLVFAIGISHGAQKMNGIMQDVGRGTHKYVAARYTFRRLFMAGLTAILAEAVGFAVLMLIDVPVIRDLVMTASIGVGLLLFSKLILLPIILSFTGVSHSAALLSLVEEREESKGKGFAVIWETLELFTRRRWALGAVGAAAVLLVFGVVMSLRVQIGDVNPGAPELRPESRYNQDVRYGNDHYGTSSDQFAVILKTPPYGSFLYPTLVAIDNVANELKDVPGVKEVVNLADRTAFYASATYDASPKWIAIGRNQEVLNYGANRVYAYNPDFLNLDLSVTPIIAYLTDHKAETLETVSLAAEKIARKFSQGDVQFLLAAGSSGIDAATNAVVKKTNRTMMLYVYAVIGLLCLITFRSWRATLVAMIPLVITTFLCEALMVMLNIGVKVSTLPVIALGVGIGIDYALYLLAVQIKHQRDGVSLNEAYKRSLRFTGKVVCLVGLTMAAAVITWAWSPIQFQADMGILLTFMFVWNMLGALILIPALSHFLLNKKLG